jgi:hypothetical protein
MAGKLAKWPFNIPAYSIARPSKIYPNLDFWFENKIIWQPRNSLRIGIFGLTIKPSGNPGTVDELGFLV